MDRSPGGRRRRAEILFTVSCLMGVAALAGGSAQAQSQLSEPAQMVDSGSWYSREQWPHDGHPYESQNFIVYSDAASQDARRPVAEIGEELLAELTTEFGIVEDEMLRFPPGQDKIHIYAYKNRNPQAWGARAYYCGFIIWSLDHEKRSRDPDLYRATAKHEMVHVVEALLKGRDVANFPVAIRVHVWFSEGLAEAITGGVAARGIRDLGYMDYLTDKYGRLSPISFKSDDQVGDWTKEETAMACSEYHYPMYQLAVEYLLDPKGYGKSLQDVARVFTDIADGSDFTTAFENRLGVRLADYEAQFFDLMHGYLDEGVFTRFRHASVAWLVLIAASLIVLAWGVARGAATRRPRILAWSFVTVLLGPLGLLGYRFSYPRPGQSVSIWRGALGASMLSVTGNVAGLALVSACLAVFQPHVRVDPLDPLIPFFAGWLIFHALLAARRSCAGYRVAFRRSLSAGFVPMVLVLAAVLGVLMPLSENWWLPLDPRTLLFWTAFSAGAMAGTAIVYPYNLWVARRA